MDAINTKEKMSKFMELMDILIVHPELKIVNDEDGGWVYFDDNGDVRIFLEIPPHLENHWAAVFIETTNNVKGYEYGWTYEGGGTQYGTYEDLMDTNRCENCGWTTENCQCKNHWAYPRNLE
jgi:hypothetical protein